MIKYDYKENYEDYEEEISDKEVRRFILKIALLVASLVAGVIAYGIMYCDFTPIIIIGFFTLPVFAGAVKLLLGTIKAKIFEN